MTTDVVGLHEAPIWTFGDRIRKIRRDAGMTLEQFAASLDYPAKRVAAWESGRTTPRDVVEVASRIRRKFRVPEWWTLGLDGPGGGGGGGGISSGNSPIREYGPLPICNEVNPHGALSTRYGLRQVALAA